MNCCRPAASLSKATIRLALAPAPNHPQRIKPVSEPQGCRQVSLNPHPDTIIKIGVLDKRLCPSPNPKLSKHVMSSCTNDNNYMISY